MAWSDVISGLVTAVCVFAFLASYFVLPGYLLIRGWPLRAGFAMLLSGLFPLYWELLTPPGGIIGPILFLYFTLPLPSMLIIVGLVANMVWLINELRRVRALGRP